jgi:hypothetical protein
VLKDSLVETFHIVVGVGGFSGRHEAHDERACDVWADPIFGPGPSARRPGSAACQRCSCRLPSPANQRVRGMGRNSPTVCQNPCPEWPSTGEPGGSPCRAAA